MKHRTFAVVLAAAAISTSGVAVETPVASSAPVRTCWAPGKATGVEKRRNISCASAQRVMRMFRAHHSIWPGCAREKSIRSNGWTASPRPRDRGWTPATRFSRGSASFWTSGGGSCF